jgi:hypothetical protein
VRAEGPREGERRSTSGAEVAAGGRCRVSARGSRRKLQQVGTSVGSVALIHDFSLGRSRHDDIRHAVREPMGLCLARSNERAPSAATPHRPLLFCKETRERSTSSPSPANHRRKKRGPRRRGPRLAGLSAGRIAAVVEDAAEAQQTVESHPSGEALLGSRVHPRPERQYPGAVLETAAAFRVPGSRGREPSWDLDERYPGSNKPS